MEWADAAEVVGKVAPVAGSLLAGAPGARVGGLVADLLGVDPTPEAVADAVNRDPQAATKLRKIEADIETSLIQGRTKAVTAEASGESWLQRNWRPLLMLWFAVLVGGYWFGLTPDKLSESTVLALFDIVQLGVTGYIVGRSAEKVTRTATGSGFMNAIKAKVK
ncbi:hypothetical protein A8U91_04725 [Halomonas elongata]|uniref:Holin of 3TMs, for gene-transfer release n=1 Tax=Halomonas elongata TaxID=2746 RepID=A0A1B8P059_HALEL|nr:3TM-type holin [Halomonas elongata]OBX35651.1 hypothetical protein A8U91_04725 [Halomonas elongata]